MSKAVVLGAAVFVGTFATCGAVCYLALIELRYGWDVASIALITAVLALVSTFPTVLALRWLMSRSRGSYPTCLNCGYNLTGNITGVCSECGSPVASLTSQRDLDIVTRAPVKRSRAWRIVACALAISIVAVVSAAWLRTIHLRRVAAVIEMLHDEDMEVVAPPISFVRWRRDSPLGEVAPNNVYLVHRGHFVARLTFTSDRMESIEEIEVDGAGSEAWIWGNPQLKTYTVQMPCTNPQSGADDRIFIRDTDGDGYPDQVIELRESRSDKYEIECARVEKEVLPED